MRVWARLEALPEEVIDAAFEEGRRRNPEQKRRWVMQVNGHPD